MEPVARRTKVTFTRPVVRPVVPEEDEDVRVYVAAPIDGLGTFDLGSVPASVTPPKSWRKAAWFATGSSAAVVVGLLFAGSLLVGKPVNEQSSQGGWPGYRGGSPLMSEEQQVGQPTSPNGGSGGKPSKDPKAANGPVVDDRSPSRETTPATTDDTAAPSTAPSTGATSGKPSTGKSSTPASSEPPQKPPISAAQRTNPNPSPWYSFPPDAQTMGNNSEKFLNTVTTDPAAASSVTTGDLHNQGPQALRQRYSDVAYFEVKKIVIDQQRGVTVNTVEVTHQDGTKTLEQKTLSFGDDDKIESDGQ
ncbi:hypothetical protein [Amycolatopsis sp. H20-H5]|uniref:hypothetical protein n=1 Tax=Amycolatopsis sp. H20-H5 TaxID=3046309 RepID=UPI002DB9951D|nr:hypothetical protein [Amycolatopsis sp. H20-H5]MEC3982015.1 hypothetical protein [Amycolatopsis sp. H20-H5]